MHGHDASTEALTEAIVRYAVDRVRLDPPPLDGPRTAAELRAMAGPTVTPEGHRRPRGAAHLRRRARAGVHLGRPSRASCRSSRRRRPRRRSCSISSSARRASTAARGSRAAGAVFAENEALRWIADLAGLPASAGGVFVSGGTAGNLSALLAARWRWRDRAGGAHDRTRGLLVASGGAHSSVAQAARAMDADVVVVPADETGRLTAAALRATVDGARRRRSRPRRSRSSPPPAPPTPA